MKAHSGIVFFFIAPIVSALLRNSNNDQRCLSLKGILNVQGGGSSSLNGYPEKQDHCSVIYLCSTHFKNGYLRKTLIEH